MHRISISPITRANSVGAVTVVVEDGKVVRAESEGTIFRGFEIILEGRDPRDAPYLTQRICGICSSAHGLAACLALEQLAGVDVPPNAAIVRNLVFGLDLVQNHIRHFYALGLWDWVAAPPTHPFQGGYTRDFRLPPGLTARYISHYWAGVDHARAAHEALTLLGGKIPHNHGIVPGGVSLVPDGDMRRDLGERIQRLAAFIEGTYLPDALLLSDTYPEYRHLGAGRPNYLSLGMFPLPGGERGIPAGVMLDGSMEALDLSHIEESHAHSYYKGDGDRPDRGTTIPDPSRDDAYSWVKAPRYRGRACQGGPLTRHVIRSGRPGSALGAMERITARAREALETARLMTRWMDEVEPGGPGSVDLEMPSSGSGVGAVEAMRGPLSHWLTVERGRIARYQIITPSAWNFSPRDGQGHPGPAEDALVGTPVKDSSQPVEIGRVIRSFDPCYACTAHVIDAGRGTAAEIRVL